MDALMEIRRGWGHCTRCDLARSRRMVVLGEGNPHARLAFVGEGPGTEEDFRGRPFIGPSGALLKSFLDALGIRREEVFITNVVCCMGPDGRKATRKERAICAERLHAELYAVDPYLVVAVGEHALHALTGKETQISKVVGEIQEGVIRGRVGPYPISVMPIFHPAYLLRNQDVTEGRPMHQAFTALSKAVDVVRFLERTYTGVELPWGANDGQEAERGT